MTRLELLAKQESDRWHMAGMELPSTSALRRRNELAAKLLKDGNSIDTINRFLPSNTSVTEITPNCHITHWSGDPRIPLLMKATIAQLPEFLTDSNLALAYS